MKILVVQDRDRHATVAEHGLARVDQLAGLAKLVERLSLDQDLRLQSIPRAAARPRPFDSQGPDEDEAAGVVEAPDERFLETGIQES